jgi:hypothetical protein
VSSADNTHSITPGAKSKVKSSVQRTIRSKVLEQYPLLEPYIEDILPKKEQLDLVKLYVPSVPECWFGKLHKTLTVRLVDPIGSPCMR